MNEFPTGYTPERFPYSDILQHLTERARQEEMLPVEAYNVFCSERKKRNLSPHFDYGSTSIMTGGHALYMPNIGEVIAANTQTARELSATLADQGTIEADRLILPVDMGKTGWSHSQFILYWGLTIAGPNMDKLARRPLGISSFETYLESAFGCSEVDIAKMNNPQLDRETRRPEYLRFIQTLAEAIKRARVECLPANRLISLVDPDISLGCWSEKQFALRMQVPVRRVMSVKEASIEGAMLNQKLRHDIHVITAAGGKVLVAKEGAFLTLVHDDVL